MTSRSWCVSMSLSGIPVRQVFEMPFGRGQPWDGFYTGSQSSSAGPWLLESQAPQLVLEGEAWLWVSTFPCAVERDNPGIQLELVPLKYGVWKWFLGSKRVIIFPPIWGILPFPSSAKTSCICTHPPHLPSCAKEGKFSYQRQYLLLGPPF